MTVREAGEHIHKVWDYAYNWQAYVLIESILKYALSITDEQEQYKYLCAVLPIAENDVAKITPITGEEA